MTKKERLADLEQFRHLHAHRLDTLERVVCELSAHVAKLLPQPPKVTWTGGSVPDISHFEQKAKDTGAPE
jgi:hypothetical protein